MINTLSIDALRNYSVFTKLLKNDVILYGKCVRQLLVENVSMKEYSKTGHVINCFAQFIFIDIIERDLDKYIIETIRYNTDARNNEYRNLLTSYKLMINDNVYRLDMLYIRPIYDIKKVYLFSNELSCIMDIDGLYISRLNIGCLDIFGNKPYMFNSIISNIDTKQFEIRKICSLTDDNVRYIQDLQTRGYHNVHSKMYILGDTDQPECSICYDKEDMDITKYIKLDCGHIYHYECLQTAIKLCFQDKNVDTFNCPYCSTKYSERELV